MCVCMCGHVQKSRKDKKGGKKSRSSKAVVEDATDPTPPAEPRSELMDLDIGNKKSIPVSFLLFFGCIHLTTLMVCFFFFPSTFRLFLLSNC